MGTPIEAEPSQTADQIVAQAVVKGLLAKGLIRQDKAVRIGDRIASGAISAEDWAVEIELASAKPEEGA